MVDVIEDAGVIHKVLYQGLFMVYRWGRKGYKGVFMVYKWGEKSFLGLFMVYMWG